MLTSEYEAILQGSETEGTSGRRPRSAKRGGRKDLLSVSMPTIKRWLKRRRETGDVEPKPIPGRPRLKGAALQEWLPSQLQHNNDLTLQEHSEAFEEETGVVVSSSTVSRAIDRLPEEDPGRSKKSQIASEVDEEARGLWRVGWLPTSTPGAWCSWMRADFTPP